MAGRESDASNPLVLDFILIARKLEKLGFTCYKDEVMLVDSLGLQ